MGGGLESSSHLNRLNQPRPICRCILLKHACAEFRSDDQHQRHQRWFQKYESRGDKQVSAQYCHDAAS